MLRRIVLILLSALALGASTSQGEMRPMPMVLVPAGAFIMGDGSSYCGVDEHEVTLTHPFYLGQYEVTNQEYRDALQWAYDQGYVKVTSSSVNDSLDGSTVQLFDLSSSYLQISFSGGTFSVDAGKEDYPLAAVSWYGAAAYCDWLSLQAGLPRAYDHSTWECNDGDPYRATGYRLPTDAEWEFAAQYDDERVYPWGNEVPGCSRANYWPTPVCVESTSAVGSYPAAPASLQLYDMAGNAYEWNNDWHTCDLGTASQTDPIGPGSGSTRVVRGGAWYFSFDLYLRGAYRNADYPSSTVYGNGFRCARSSLSPRVLRVPVGYPSISSALSNASPGDTILVSPGTYYEHDLEMKSGVVLVGEAGPESTIVDAGDLGRCLQCTGTDASTLISGFSFIRGAADDGGAISCVNGAIRVERCHFETNVASDDGGGLYGYGASVLVAECDFVGNSANDGGGILCRRGSSLLLRDCLFRDNWLTWNGWGGGVCCYDSAFADIERCVFISNTVTSSPGRGGGLGLEETEATVSACTFFGNFGGAGAGGIDCLPGSTLTLENTIVSFSSWGAAVGCAYGGIATLTCCDLYGNAGGDWVGCIASQEGMDGNLSGDPQFCDPANGDFSISLRSPCAPQGECGLIGSCGIGCGGPRCWHVYADGSGDAETIGAGLDSAIAGDTVLVGPGTYEEHDIALKNGVVLRAETDHDATTVDAQQLGRVFHCVDVDSTTKIQGFTIRNGWAELGAGILCESSSPEITDCVFSYNTGENPLGGGIALIGSSPRLTDCLFYENGAVSGGAVYCEDSHLWMSGCTVVANLALSGSGVYCKDGSVVSMENSIVAFGLGAEAVACATGSSAALTCCDVYGNEGGDWVGCIAGQQGVAGNFSLDPLFCSATYHMYDLYPESPCAAENNPSCGLIGALAAGCDFTGVAGGGNVPRAFSLSANWPNPFNPITSIRFALPERAEVDVTLYDAAGRRVARLAAGVYEAGEHTITWNGLDDAGRQVPSGIYFARLHAGEYGDVRKMVLIK